MAGIRRCANYRLRCLAVHKTAVDGHRASGGPQCKCVSDAICGVRVRTCHVVCAHAVFTTI
eukprot:3381132-Prymnesium_polylepis.1